jgi:riboflavin biosynthesis pyrimidine reductase
MQELLAGAQLDPTALHDWYARDWVEPGGVRVNFIASVDGAVSAGGLSRGLQTPGDNAVFAALRDLADVIVVGASTAAAEGYRPANPSTTRRAARARYGLAERPAIAVVSASLTIDLGSELFAAAPREAPTLIITGPAAPVARRTDIIDLADGDTGLQLFEAAAGPDGGVDLAAAVAILRERGYRRILCEGGPRLFSAGLAAGAVDELCLTISPVLAGPGAGRIVSGPGGAGGIGARLALMGVLTEEAALFCRYRVLRPA